MFVLVSHFRPKFGGDIRETAEEEPIEWDAPQASGDERAFLYAVLELIHQVAQNNHDLAEPPEDSAVAARLAHRSGWTSLRSTRPTAVPTFFQSSSAAVLRDEGRSTSFACVLGQL